jgi:hypothetical protein
VVGLELVGGQVVGVVEEEVLHAGGEFAFHCLEDVVVLYELWAQEDYYLVEFVQPRPVALRVLLKLTLVSETYQLDCKLLRLKIRLKHLPKLPKLLTLQIKHCQVKPLYLRRRTFRRCQKRRKSQIRLRLFILRHRRGYRRKIKGRRRQFYKLFFLINFRLSYKIQPFQVESWRIHGWT